MAVNTKISINKILRGSVFLVVFVFISYQLTFLFYPKTDVVYDAFARNQAFYDQPKNTIDVLFFGASPIRRGMNPLIMWNEYGFTSFDRSAGGQMPILSYYQVVESVRSQTPKVVVLDTPSMFSLHDVDIKEGNLRPNIDAMRFSDIKLFFIREVVSLSEHQTFLSYLFPLIRYHSRWDQLERLDFEVNLRKTRNNYRGYYGIFLEQREITFPDNFMSPTAEVANFDPESLGYLKKMIEFCLEKGIEVVLVTMPRSSWSYSQHNAVQIIADQYGLPYIDYCLPEEFARLGINAKIDFSTSKHLSMVGAEKISLDMGSFLSKSYQLKDKRNDLSYVQWHIDYDNFISDYLNGVELIRH